MEAKTRFSTVLVAVHPGLQDIAVDLSVVGEIRVLVKQYFALPSSAKSRFYSRVWPVAEWE